MTPSSIIILDNYPVLRLGLKKLLQELYKELTITEVSSVQNLELYKNTVDPDLIILGINDNAEDKDLSQYLEVRQLFPNVPVIVYDEVIYNFQTLPYLEFGIDGYLLKQQNPAEFARCIEIVASGKRYICNEVLQNLFNGFLQENSSVARKQLLSNLRNRSWSDI